MADLQTAIQKFVTKQAINFGINQAALSLIGDKIAGFFTLAFASENLGGWQDPNTRNGYTFNPADGKWYSAPPNPSVGDFAWSGLAPTSQQDALNSYRVQANFANAIENNKPSDGSAGQVYYPGPIGLAVSAYEAYSNYKADTSGDSSISTGTVTIFQPSSPLVTDPSVVIRTLMAAADSAKSSNSNSSISGSGYNPAAQVVAPTGLNTTRDSAGYVAASGANTVTIRSGGTLSDLFVTQRGQPNGFSESTAFYTALLECNPQITDVNQIAAGMTVYVPQQMTSGAITYYYAGGAVVTDNANTGEYEMKIPDSIGILVYRNELTSSGTFIGTQSTYNNQNQLISQIYTGDAVPVSANGIGLTVTVGSSIVLTGTRNTVLLESGSSIISETSANSVNTVNVADGASDVFLSGTGINVAVGINATVTIASDPNTPIAAAQRCSQQASNDDCMHPALIDVRVAA